MALIQAKLAVLWLLSMNPAAEQPPTPRAGPKPAAKDRYGDPLPPGALARMGTIRLRHGGPVRAVAFTPDGKTVVSGGSDGWVFQWDASTGKRLRRFRVSAINGIAIDPAGKTLALASAADEGVKLYSLATGKELAALPGQRGGAEVVAFSPDGKLLAGGGKDNTVHVWNVATAREVHSWRAGRPHLPSLRFTPDGKRLVCHDEDGALLFRDIATGTERRPPGPLADARTAFFCFSAEGKVLITGNIAGAGSLHLWDAASGKEIRAIARTEGLIAPLVAAADGKTVWTAGPDGHPRQWDLADGKPLLRLPASINDPRNLTLSPDGKLLATGDREGNVFLWDAKTGRKTLDFEGHHGSATAAAFTPDGRRLWTGGHDHTIRLWETASGEQLRCFSTERDNDNVYSLALRPDGKMLAVAVLRKTNSPQNEKCDVRLWDLTAGVEREPLRGHGGWVEAVAFSADGRTLASRGLDQTIRVWDVATGKERRRLRCGEAHAKGVCFSPDGSRVVASLDKETIGFWDVETGRLARRLSAGPSAGLMIPLLSQDGRMLVTGGGGQPLRVWEVASGKERCRVEGSKLKGYSVIALSPDNRLLAAGGDSRQPIQLWDLGTGELLGTLGAGAVPAFPSRMAFSPDGRSLASSHYEGTALIWDVARLSPAPGAAAKHSAGRLDKLWGELASEDAAKAYGALRALAAAPEQSLPVLRRRLSEAAKIKADPARIAHLLADLDSEQFAVREQASRELQGLGMVGAPAMRRALSKNPALEVRRRLEQVLEKLESGARPAEELRTLRAVEVLERIASPEARRLLEELARGRPDGWLTQEAKASLARLAARSAVKP